MRVSIYLHCILRYNPREAPHLPTDDGTAPSRVPIISTYRIPDVSDVDDRNKLVTMTVVSYKQWVDHRIKVIILPNYH